MGTYNTYMYNYKKNNKISFYLEIPVNNMLLMAVLYCRDNLKQRELKSSIRELLLEMKGLIS